jgi:predicted chitinase
MAEAETLTATEMRARLAAMYPNAIPAWRDALCDIALELWDFYDFDRLRWVHFCGQIAAETNSLALPKMEENMNFRSAQRIMEVYSYRLGIALKREPTLKARFVSREALAAYLVGKPKELAYLVYGGREGTPWRQGSKYVGRGPTQVTHLNGYRAVGEEIARQPGGGKFDLVSNPDKLATDPELGVRAAFADWHIKGLARYADKDDCDTLSDALNTGNIRDNVKPHGLSRRRSETAKAKKVWPKEFTIDVPIVSVPVPTPAPIVPPLSTGELAQVSRKVRFLVRVRNVIATGFSLFTFAGVMDMLGYVKGVYDGIYHMAQDNALALGITTGVLALAGISYIISLVHDDQSKGTYVPSGLVAGVGAGSAGAPVGGSAQPSGEPLGSLGHLPAPLEA